MAKKERKVFDTFTSRSSQFKENRNIRISCTDGKTNAVSSMSKNGNLFCLYIQQSKQQTNKTKKPDFRESVRFLTLTGLDMLLLSAAAI